MLDFNTNEKDKLFIEFSEILISFIEAHAQNCPSWFSYKNDSSRGKFKLDNLI